MRKHTKVTLLKSGSRLVVDPTTSRIRALLEPQLTFTEKKFFHGWEARQRKNAKELPFEFIDWECFGDDHKGRLGCGFGFWKRIYDTLRKAGYQVVMEDMTPHPRPEVFVPQWDRLEKRGIQLRHGQAQFLTALFGHRCGRLWCPPAFGKSTMIGVIGLLLPKARIDVVSKRVAVVRDRIYPELCQILPDVGIVGGSKKSGGHRIMCYTAGSMHYADGNADILIGDEGHELVADSYARKFGIWENAHNYALSATWYMRLDGKDLRGEGIFGPIIYQMDYQEAQAHGLVSRITVCVTPVIMDFDPCEGARDDIEKQRLGIWTNDFRNDLIAADARRYGPDEQVLITCGFLEHAVHLKQRLPEFQLVYREEGMSPKERHNYVKYGLIPSNEPHMDIERRMQLTRRFERGKLKKAICTTVWNVGVNFKHLNVVIRADAGGSPINDTQIPGRVSRIIHGVKTHGIVHDYGDQFNRGFRTKGEHRVENYESNGWTIKRLTEKGYYQKELF